MRDQYFVVVLTAAILCGIQSKAEVAGSAFGKTVRSRIQEVEFARKASIVFPQPTPISAESTEERLLNSSTVHQPSSTPIRFRKIDPDVVLDELDFADTL